MLTEDQEDFTAQVLIALIVMMHLLNDMGALG
jgi:hypothetical protein